MAITIPEGISTRAKLRDHLRDTLSTLVTDHTQDVPGGEWDGVPVITIKDLGEAIAATFGGDLPTLDAKVAEISTPGTVYVSADCPDCHQRQNLTAEVDGVLSIDRSGRELKAKFKTKAKTHVCGQQPLPAAVDGQESFELGDITNQDSEAPLEVVPSEPCPSPGCVLAAEHEGDHDVPPADDADEDELLPA